MSNGRKSFSDIATRLSRRLFPVRGLAAAAAILFVIGTAGFLSVEYIKHNAWLVVEDTLAGLRDSSMVNANLIESFNSMVLLNMADTPAERQHCREDFQRYNDEVSAFVTAYSGSIFTGEDQANYQRLLACREEYLKIHRQIFDLVDAGKYSEAKQLFRVSFMPVYMNYKAAAGRVMKYNEDEGKSRGKIILQVCTVTQFFIAGAGIVLFGMGFLLGLFR
jgi:hypothetical protein